MRGLSIQLRLGPLDRLRKGLGVLEMGPPTLLGGGLFQIDRGRFDSKGPMTGIWRRGQDSPGLIVLSEVATLFRKKGYKITKSKRGKSDDVRFRCNLGDYYVELILVTEGHAEQLLSEIHP